MCVHSCRVAKGTSAEPFTIHFAMFIPTISNLGTREQSDKWLPLASSFEASGTYAQTEIGHGQSFSLTESWDMYIQSHRVTVCYQNLLLLH